MMTQAKKKQAVDQVRGLGPGQHASGTASCWKTPRSRCGRTCVEILKTLDERGILHSIASRNDHDTAMAKLEEFGLDEYFLYPQINWNSKAASIAQIAKDINIGLDAIAFVDDQPFEREEVAFTHDKVLCIDSALLDDLLDRPELNPRFITEDSQPRRRMYMADIRRNREEEEFVGPKEEFLATLGHGLHHRARPRGGPEARRGADRAHEPAQHHRLHLLLRGAGRAAASRRATSCSSPASRTGTAPTARSASP